MLHNIYLYIDPGTGSLIAQAVLAGIIAGWVFFKNAIRKMFFRSKTTETAKVQEKQNTD